MVVGFMRDAITPDLKMRSLKMQLKPLRLILMLVVTLTLLSPSLSLAQLSATHDSTPLTLDNKEQHNLGSYIKGCEVDHLQMKFYEDNYNELSKELDGRPSTGTIILSYLLVFAGGYIAGVKH